jgi:restriction system protein
VKKIALIAQKGGVGKTTIAVNLAVAAGLKTALFDLDQQESAVIPTYDQLIVPLWRAMKALGGSGSIEEIYDKVVELEHLPDDVVAQAHDPERSNQTEVGYRLAWARTYLKKYGLLENSSRGIWSLTPKANDVEKLNPQEIVKAVKAAQRGAPEVADAPQAPDAPQELDWRQRLHGILTKKLPPAAFERLVQRMLREAGFTQVEVTGRVGDGGIDGKGIARIHGLMSFHVLFQCKRYTGSVGAGEIRDFRGAMVGRADKGLFITTGTFTPGAVKEATRDGAPPIDLLNGSDFADKLKELSIGIRTEKVELVHIEEAWFDTV